jgi:hypothetical protein
MNNVYVSINVSLIVILLFSVLYFFLFYFNIIEVPKCYYLVNYGVKCSTCGLTRDFKEIISKGISAEVVNLNSHKFFIFFIFSFFSRFIFLSFWCFFIEKHIVVIADIFLSGIVFFLMVFTTF